MKSLNEMTYNELLDAIDAHERKKERIDRTIYAINMELQKRRAHVQKLLFRPKGSDSTASPRA